MKTVRTHSARVLLVCLLVLLALVLLTPQTITAQGPDGDRRVVPDGQAQGEIAPQATANLVKYLTVTQKGGYVAKGVGLRWSGAGDIAIAGIPAGATVTHAFLFWNVFAPVKAVNHSQGTLNGHTITGSLVGSDIADYLWVAGDRTWTYRAAVKAYMLPGGNGTYHLSGFPVGPGGDPRIMGATLVILFSKSNYPLTTVQIYNGAAPSPCCAGRTLRLQVTGINAVAPTGFAYTTFIGADGVGGGVSTFNTIALPTVVWGGAEGQYWDTMTVDVHALLDPPETDFWLTAKMPNGATWVAQVVAYSNGSQDTDGDRLKDGWELNGYRDPATGAFVDLPAMGANPLHKDLFVEADYMLHPDTGEDHLPTKGALDDIVYVFNAAPVSNPDGTTGVHIYLDTGGAAHGAAAGTYPAYNLGGGNNVGYQEHLGADTPNCSSYDWSQFDAKKNANFSSARTKMFHYMIFAHDLAPCLGGVSGMSRNGSTDALFIQGATNFIVSLGSWGIEGQNWEREGTFIHELGHNLGLRHGGNDHQNWKPNYLSVMNYLYQTWGVPRNHIWYRFDYSRNEVPTLNETALNEPAGLGPTAAAFGVAWLCPNGGKTYSLYSNNVDWDCDGDGASETSLSYDLNHSGAKSVLGNQNNWANVTFKGGGTIGASMSAVEVTAQAPRYTRWVDELTFETVQKMQLQGAPTHP